jgi:hypothetical protein
MEKIQTLVGYTVSVKFVYTKGLTYSNIYLNIFLSKYMVPNTFEKMRYINKKKYLFLNQEDEL